jgi:hypothetical protein
LSRSETMGRGTPCNRTIFLKNNSAICEEASWILWQGIKWAILLKWSTTTKIESFPLLVLCKRRTISIEISYQGTLGIGKGVYKPQGFKRHVGHRWTCLSTSRLIFGQKKLWTSTCSVFLAPKFPIRPLVCASYKNIMRREQSGMQSLLTWTRNPSWKWNFS